MSLQDLFPFHAAILAAAVLVALLLDLWLGEPPTRWHPVVWMGAYLGAVGQRISRPAGNPSRPGTEFILGALGWCAGAWVIGSLAALAAKELSQWHALIQVLLLGLLLKPMLAWRMLRDEVQAVEAALGQSLAAGRERLRWLVSRDVTLLDEHQVRGAAMSTLAENLNDSVIAPLFWFAVAGLPGAAIYRFANTADAMWGYLGPRGGRDWTWAGKWAARADDVLSWLPARITAALLYLLAGGRGWQTVAANARQTPSPNGGWPMGALAVGLGIRLVKPGVYALHPQGRLPEAADTACALRLGGRAVASVACLAGLVWLAGLGWQ